jgi:hypothetical protein
MAAQILFIEEACEAAIPLLVARRDRLFREVIELDARFIQTMEQYFQKTSYAALCHSCGRRHPEISREAWVHCGSFVSPPSASYIQTRDLIDRAREVFRRESVFRCIPGNGTTAAETFGMIAATELEIYTRWVQAASAANLATYEMERASKGNVADANKYRENLRERITQTENILPEIVRLNP